MSKTTEDPRWREAAEKATAGLQNYAYVGPLNSITRGNCEWVILDAFAALRAEHAERTKALEASYLRAGNMMIGMPRAGPWWSMFHSIQMDAVSALGDEHIANLLAGLEDGHPLKVTPSPPVAGKETRE